MIFGDGLVGVLVHLFEREGDDSVVRRIWVNRLWHEDMEEFGFPLLAGDAFLHKEIYATVFEGVALV